MSKNEKNQNNKKKKNNQSNQNKKSELNTENKNDNCKQKKGAYSAPLSANADMTSLCTSLPALAGEVTTRNTYNFAPSLRSSHSSFN